jgi:thiol-disulfide isomerase/thioredoxin
VAFAVGVAIPLFAFAMAGGGISRRLSAYRRRSRAFRIGGGTVMVLLALALTFNLTDGLQRAVPGYTQALQARVEDGPAARAALAGLNQQAPSPTEVKNPPTATTAGAATTSTPAPPTPAATTPAPPAEVAQVATGPVMTCVSHARTLANCGPAPAIIGIQSWLNTPQDQPIALSRLHGKVVLVNFWTFSCINCQRTLPYLKAWYRAYHSSGLEIIAVHTPEFSYEHALGNVQDAVRSDGITYPVALDNTSATWRNYNNAYWPAQYLLDAQGTVRHVVDGEGGYTDSERLIRQLLRAANPAVALPAPIDPAVPVG